MCHRGRPTHNRRTDHCAIFAGELLDHGGAGGYGHELDLSTPDPGRRSLTLRAGAVLLAVASVAMLLAAPQPAHAAAGGYPRLAFWNSWQAPTTEMAKRDYAKLAEADPRIPARTAPPSWRSTPARNSCRTARGKELNYKVSNSDPAFEARRIGAIPTSWILLQVGSTLPSGITSSVRSIPVVDGSKFRTGDLVICGDEKMYVSALSGNTLTVTRGMAGSVAVSHAAGARINPAVSVYPGSVTLNITPDCPLGMATGQFASPVPERAHDWMARRNVGFFRARDYDGMALDCCEEHLWYSYGTAAGGLIRSIGTVADPNVAVPDYAAWDDTWQAGMREQFALIRAGAPNAVIIGNANASPDYFDGALLEQYPARSWSLTKWNDRIVSRAAGIHHRYALLQWQALSRNPSANTVRTMGTQTDYASMRFGLCTTLLSDAYYWYSDPGANNLWWYDEYDNAGAGKGYLGQPTGAAYSVGSGSWRRNYQGGIVLVNPGDASVTIPLGGTYKKIAGTQDRVVNDGSFVTAVTIPAKDGIVLLTPGKMTATKVTAIRNSRNPRHGKRATFSAYIAPGSAAVSGTTKLSLYRCETKTVKKRIRGRWKRVKVKYWRLRATKTMSPSPSGRVAASYRPRYAGSWKMKVDYSGSLGSPGVNGYWPSSRTKTFRVK